MKEKLISNAKELGYINAFGEGFLINKKHKGIEWCMELSNIQKWLREKKDIHITIERSFEPPHFTPSGYMNEVWRHEWLQTESATNFKTYEEALEDGLQEALKLIE